MLLLSRRGLGELERKTIRGGGGGGGWGDQSIIFGRKGAQTYGGLQ